MNQAHLPPAPAPASPRWHAPALCLLVLFGGGLRLWHLDAWPLVGDEVETLDESIGLFRPEELHKTRSVLISGPLVQVCCQALLEAGLPAAWALRLVPFLSSLGALALVAFGTSRLFGTRAALAALTLLVLCPLHYYASSFGRYLAPVFLCGAASGLALLAWMRGGRARDLVLAGLWSLLGIAFHVTFGLVAASLLVAALVTAGSGRRTLCLLGGGVALLAVVLVLALGGGDGPGLLREVSSRVGPLQVRSPLPLVLGLVHDVGLGVIGMAAAGWLLARREHPREMALVAVVFVVVTGVLLVLGTRLQVGPRYLIGLVPWILVLAGVGLDRATRLLGSRAGGLALLGLTLAPTAPVFLSQLVDNSRYDVAALAAMLDREVAPGERVLAEAHNVVEFYTGLPCEELPTRAGELRALLEGEPRAFLVLLLQRGRVVGTGDRGLQQFVEQNATLLRQVTHRRLDAHQFETRLYRWDRPPPRGD